MIAQSWLGRISQTLTTVDWDSVYADTLPRVFHFFCYRVGDKALAEDLTSITFEKAWRNRHRYQRDVAGFEAWLFTIARNVAIDHFRSAPPVDSLDEDDQDRLASPESIETALEQKDAYQMLSRLLHALPQRDRELIALKYGTGLSNRSIGELIGMSETHVSTHLSRLVQKLRAQWDEARP